MAAETIRSFLVSLGFKTDQATLKKFEDSITAATTKAKLLADGIEKMAKTVIDGIHSVAVDLSNLYYASVRIGTSASNLKALTQTAEDFGVSAEEALGFMEGLSKILNTDPAKESYLNSLGVQTRKVNGEMRDMQDIVNDFSQALGRFPPYLQQRFADMYGMSYKLRLMFTDPGFLQDLEKHQKLLGDGYNASSREAAQLLQQFREVGDRWEKLKQKFTVNVFGPMIRWIEEGEKYLAAHEPNIEEYITRFGQTIERTYKVIKAILGTVDWHKLIGVDEFEQLFKRIEQVGQYLNRTSGKFSWVTDWILGKSGIKDAVDKAMKEPLTFKFRFPSDAESAEWHNPGNLKYAGQPGAVRAGGSPEQRQFAAFRTDEEGMLAMARQLRLYGQRGLNNINSIVSTYAPRGDNDTAAYIADVAAQMHRAAGASLNLNDPAVLAAMMNAMIQHEHNANPYSPALVRGAAEQATRGGAPVVVQQTNTIHIDGSKDPAVTKKIVVDTLSELNHKAVRALQPTTQ